MSWTDYSNTTADLWVPASSVNSTDVFIQIGFESWQIDGFFTALSTPGIPVNSLAESYNIPGFDDGYQPSYVPNPIEGNLGEPDPNGGGGGSSRPTTGFLHPRGQG